MSRYTTGMEWPATDRYQPGTRVQVTVPNDPHAKQIGMVTRTYAEAGDMVHVVEFTDGGKADYLTTELAALT